MRRIVLVSLLAIAGCKKTPVSLEWRVTGETTPELTFEAMELVSAAKYLMPIQLRAGWEIRIHKEIGDLCFGPGTDVQWVVTGCVGFGAIYVKWPHPGCPSNADLSCSALAHELCHVAYEGNITDEQADACAAAVKTEFNRGLR